MKCANTLSRTVDSALSHLRSAVLELEKLSDLSEEDALFRKHFLARALPLLTLQSGQPRFAGQRILLGLPAGGQREQIRGWLLEWGLKPEVCEDCPTVYRLALQSNRLGLVLLNERLPGYQGTGSLQSIRQAGGAPVIAIADDPVTVDQLQHLLEKSLKAAPKPPAKLNGELGRQHPLKVLIAEDLALNQKLIGLLLSRMGYQADTANNGYEVMLKVEQEDYDLILMDLNMPGMNGLEAAARVRQLKPLATGGPRLVAMSANLPNGTPQGSGFEEFLAKPVQFDQLQSVLKNSPSRRHPDRRSEGPSLPVLDPEVMKNLHRLGDRDFLESLIEDAAQELPQMVGMLMDCWARGQAGEVTQLAHAIKGSASTLGAVRVAGLAGEIEQCGKTRQLHGEPVSALAAALDEALEHLQR